MVDEHRWPFILLPGGILPVGPAYQALLAELGDDVDDARAKELEMYAGGTVPPDGYSSAASGAARSSLMRHAG